MRVRLPKVAALALLSAGAAVWPVWRWYALRLTDGSDEPWGALALVTLAGLRMRDGFDSPVGVKRLLAAASMLTFYAASYDILPPLGRAVIAMAALGALVLPRSAAGLWGLLGLSLPITATLQFYLGYPLRLLAAESSALTLRICGIPVTREGTLLQWAGETVMVDAPCSGIHMLWCGAYLAFLLAAFYRLNVLQTFAGVGGAFLIVIFANIVRATALFFKESHMVALPAWTHEGIGIAVFFVATLLIFAVTEKLRSKPCVG